MSENDQESMPDDWGREFFLIALLRELSGTLESVIGLAEAEGFISVVGQRIGDRMNAHYRAAWGTKRIDAKRIPEALVDLKRRLDGDFFVEEESDDRIVLGNRRCPFGDAVKGRPSLCMMTSNVFGTIVSENLGYASVRLEETIAQGDSRCRVVIDLDESNDDSATDAREYFGSSGRDAE